MLEKSFGLLYFLKKPKNSKGKRTHVYARITVDGIAKEFSIKQFWFTDRWDQRTNRAMGNKEDARSLNNYLDILTTKVYQFKKSLLEQEQDITAEKIYRLVLGKTEDKKMILEIFQ